ncbi:MAG TPA: THUMP domain-containing protein [Thermoanaerobaculia bacterium]|nr:THUMP domain-containing protein [Thermoanaerobaculia bacterium]
MALDRTYLLRFSGDLSTKRGRAFAQFRGQLARNLRAAMRDHGLSYTLQLARNRFFLSSTAEAADVLTGVFGIQSFSPVEHRAWSTFDDLVRAGEELFTEAVRGRKFSVRVRRSRIRGQVDWTSENLERALGTRLLPHSSGVDLSRPEVTASIELDSGIAHLFCDVVPGPAGLPIGCEGRVLALISGGIDSAAAAWLLLKRGAQVDYLFYNLGGSEHENQVLEVIDVLVRRWSYGYRPKLWLHDLRPSVDAIRERTPERLWQVVLKRLMLRGGQAIASRSGALALVTGEAIGQVSSQTLENLAAIESGSPLPVLRPLLGFDKGEIVALARRVGTYDLSAKVPEYCALQGRAPAIAVRAADLDAAERSLDLEAFTASVAEAPRLDLRVRRRAAREATEPLALDFVPDDAMVLDLRSPAAFASWHYPGAVRMDYSEALRAHTHVDPARTYLVCCEVEFKSADLAERLRAAGRRAHYFAGGTTKLLQWAAARELVDPASIAPALHE